MPVSCELYVFSERGLCNGPIPPPEDIYRVCVGLLPVATITLYSTKG